MWWLLIPAYIIGALGAFRWLVLDFQNDADKALAAYKPRKIEPWQLSRAKPTGRWQDESDALFLVPFGTGFWFVWVTGWLISRFMKATYWLVYRGLFPRGVKSKFAKKQGLQAQIEAKDRELALMADNIRRVSQEGRPENPGRVVSPMWRVIFFTALGLLAFGGWSFLWFVAGARFHENVVKKDGLAGMAGAELLKKGAEILDKLVNPAVITLTDTTDLISTETSIRITDWLKSFNKWREKK